MSQGNGMQGSSENDRDPLPPSTDIHSDTESLQQTLESDYRRLLDDADPAVAKQIISLIQQDHRYQHKRATWESVARIFGIFSAVITIGAIIAVVIYLFVHGEKGAGQTILTGVNAIAVLAAGWSFWVSSQTLRNRKDRHK
jgi:hypothetical protein